MNLQKTEISQPYSLENLIMLLTRICNAENTFSEYDFAKWCDNFTIIFDDVDVSSNTEEALAIARDIECQWDLYLVNTYSIKELQNIDLNMVRLPHEWYTQWLKELNEIEPF